ncbi:hypothetical protein BDB00DRAFT_800725 [Zychaea mexicana]|uniref:uncharacterized protein n=1 Tax=Zychaea mexicana TaxID=64656 RepID=UPI0022FEB5F9|nr:uncharacterized protein BDB00DRAFT_800725 [Zychaea mexicana]KAI9498029.1 hypothetical protein BDB00DRAFT_800725 [Zychaea mexicana]
MLHRTIRRLITVSRAEAAQGTRKRPMPVLFVGTDTTPALTQRWQTLLSESGFDSATAQLGISNNKDPRDGNALLQSWYTDLDAKVRDLAMFPPVLIGHGEAAWRLCQKYVANQPLSGLILIDGPSAVDPKTLPSFEFEPYFPILAVSRAPSFLIESEVDIIKKDGDDDEMDQVLEWIQECF